MPKFSLQIQEHEDFGYNGIIIKTDRNYFQPTTGIGVAHDILEHPTSPHENGYIDEFLAIGSFLAGRIKYGWISEFGRQVNEKDIIADVESLALNSLHLGDDLCPEVCTNYLQDDELMEQIKDYVVSGLLNAINDFEGQNNFWSLIFVAFPQSIKIFYIRHCLINTVPNIILRICFFAFN